MIIRRCREDTGDSLAPSRAAKEWEQEVSHDRAAGAIVQRETEDAARANLPRAGSCSDPWHGRKIGAHGVHIPKARRDDRNGRQGDGGGERAGERRRVGVAWANLRPSICTRKRSERMPIARQPRRDGESNSYANAPTTSCNTITGQEGLQGSRVVAIGVLDPAAASIAVRPPSFLGRRVGPL